MQKVKTEKTIGVWLDHRKAHFIDVSKSNAVVETAFSDMESNLRYKREAGNGTLLGNNRSTNSEHHAHNREQRILDDYYKMITDRLKGYDDILLFGPSNAKYELSNKLNGDKHFAQKRIDVVSADHLTENQMVAEVRKFFGH